MQVPGPIDARTGQVWRLKHDPTRRIQLTGYRVTSRRGHAIWYVTSLNNGTLGTVGSDELPTFWELEMEQAS